MTDHFPRPSWKDWLLLIGSLTFVAAGVFLWSVDRSTAIVTLAFFGSCTVVAAYVIVRKVQLRRSAAEALIEVPYGVALRPPAIGVVVIGVWLLLLGSVLWAFSVNPPVVITAINISLMLFGGSLLLGWAVGRLPVGFVRLDPDVLTIGLRRGAVTVPWNAIGGVHIRQCHGHVVIAFEPLDVGRIVCDPPVLSDKIARDFAWAARLGAPPLMIMQTQVDVPLPTLYAAIRARLK